MTVCVFLGPTLPVSEARKILDAEYLPPVRQGDVYRAVRRFRPRMIGIVDGHFHQVPSVWHKEILFAMAEGAHVFGSASMGALRAAELHAFGMLGVGEVFAAFRDDVLEDDDEVAVVHGPAELDFVAASEAMVNIRWTLDAASAEGIIGTATQRTLTDIAKSLFYPERSYSALLQRGSVAGCSADELTAFDAWRVTGRIDVKRDDALSMLCDMATMLDSDVPPKSIDYSFEHTTMWEAATSAIRQADRTEANADDRSIDTWLIDEIRLDDAAFDTLWRPALLRVLALDEADRMGLRVHDDDLREAMSDFRLERGLMQGGDFRAWLDAHDLDRQTFERLVEEKRLLDDVMDSLQERAADIALSELHLGNDYQRLRARARDKSRILGSEDADQELTTDLRAITWYFERRDGSAPPEDLEAYARQRGFPSAADFRRAVTREFLYWHWNDEAKAP